ncbi:hypothetical protein LEP1GSC083_0040 [Leptospira interrogans serovar Pyrogenes str. L0374]|uniref:Uncharacterized protein n=1 Tax=Leptospira interrogans serovar Pyrogenes str. L0374 TaxID=1049928 RepID=M6KFC4_LEPIR|nr:hypothetical protein LEP1GSC083_0040 [Leptospira interrogans serovar Pyrogenes str. L0374]
METVDDLARSKQSKLAELLSKFAENWEIGITNAIEVIWFFLDRPKELFNSKTTKENT